MSPRAAVLIETGPSGFDVLGVVVTEREGLLITALSPPLLGAMELVSHVRGAAETQRGLRGRHQIKRDLPRLRETPSKIYPR